MTTFLKYFRIGLALGFSVVGSCNYVVAGEKPIQAPPVSRVVYVEGKPMILTFPGTKTTVTTTTTVIKPIQAPAVQKTTTVTREVVTSPAPFIQVQRTTQVTTAPYVVGNSYGYTGTVQYAAPTYTVAPTTVRYGITNRGVMQCDSFGCRLVSPR